MTLRELLGRASISDVWVALGGGELRHGRGKGFWRDGDGDNIAINESKDVFTITPTAKVAAYSILSRLPWATTASERWNGWRRIRASTWTTGDR